MDDLKKKYLENLAHEEKEEFLKHSEAVDLFKDYVLKKNIILEDSAFRYFQTIGIVAQNPGLLMKLEPDLVRDKDGLFDFQNLSANFEKHIFTEGCFSSTLFAIMASDYFRRGFYKANSFAPRFVELFWKLNEPKIQKFIALNLDSVRINTDKSSFRELDTWYGAKFSREIASISDGVSKLRPPLDLDGFDISFFFSDVYSLDVKWSTKKGIKSFQMEEFKTDKIKIIKDGKEYFPVRYIHAEFVLGSNFFQHFDGAIHFYTPEEYYNRRDSDFNYNAKNDSHVKGLSQKLFRMDGEVSIETWILFTSHFLTGNPLIFEYFEGEYPVHIKELLDKIRSF